MSGTSRRACVIAIAVIAGLLAVRESSAEVPHLIRYQGQAVDAQGVPLEGPYTLTFRLYDAATGGTPVWEEAHADIPLQGGHFSVLLGQVTPLDGMNWQMPSWLSVQVGTEPELAPRQQVTSVPLAIRAQVAESLSDAIPAGGDLSGTYPNPTVTKLQSYAVSSTAPAQGDVLRWDGSKWLASTSPSMNVQVFTSSGTFIVPPNVTKVFVKAVGGGGGGGSGISGGRGGGGGGGGYAEGVIAVSANVIVTVGSGGDGGTNTNSGSAGGNSSFAGETTLTANGGSGGRGYAQGRGEGAGGSGSGGALVVAGAAGTTGGTSSGGNGGNSALVHGFGGSGAASPSAPSVYGGGGGGSEGGNAGAAGSAGFVQVSWNQ